MLIKKVTILLILGIFFALFTFYFINQFSPFNISKLQEFAEKNEINNDENLNESIQTLIDQGQILNYLSSNSYIALISVLISFLLIFISVHLTLDKLFFKKFYEPPSTFDAVRRGFLISLSIGVYLYLNLYGVDKITLFSIPVIAVLLEIFIYLNLRKGIYNKLIKIRSLKED